MIVVALVGASEPAKPMIRGLLLVSPPEQSCARLLEIRSELRWAAWWLASGTAAAIPGAGMTWSGNPAPVQADKIGALAALVSRR